MYFPITIVDNFYPNFDEIKNFAENLEFYKKNKFSMPGLETKLLSELHFNFFKNCTLRVLASYYKRYELQSIVYNCESRFEKILPYGEQYDKEGWVHSDDTNKLSCILYLDGEYDEGTSFFKNKSLGVDYSLFNYKHELFKGNKPDPKEYNFNLRAHNNQFEEILKVPLIKNRAVIFDSSIFHRANGYGSLSKPRIIQTFFFGEIISDSFPINEIHRI